MIIRITVSGGVGTMLKSTYRWIYGISIIAPTASPAPFNFTAIDEDGFLIREEFSIPNQKSKLDTVHRLNGVCTYSISGPATDGLYLAKLLIKP